MNYVDREQHVYHLSKKLYLPLNATIVCETWPIYLEPLEWSKKSSGKI